MSVVTKKVGTCREGEQALRQKASARQAAIAKRFFKTGAGEYGADDIFLGVKVPVQRQIARQFKDLPLAEITKLLHSKNHECRLTALFILVSQYQQSDAITKAKIARLYLGNIKWVNNWDLVDSSAPYILGDYLRLRSRQVLYKLARSQNLWERRVAILATQNFIRHGEFADTLKIAGMLIVDEHDLIHKAVGWMLREIGNCDLAASEQFLKKFYRIMPRTMLRYAIEKYPPKKREYYLKKS